MNIVNIPINKLKFYDKNPRKNDGAVDIVAKNIQEFGWKVPCVIDKNNVIVCGHTRVKAAKKLGITEIPCIMADDLTDEQIKAFRLSENKSHEFSFWDFDLLKLELDNIFDIDMVDFGFMDVSEEKEGTQTEKDMLESIDESYFYLIKIPLSIKSNITVIIENIKSEYSDIKVLESGEVANASFYR